jgi:hypothetical protein
MPFLDEEEGQQVSQLLTNAKSDIINYRAKHKCDLATARRNVKPEALKKIEELTGMPGIHVDIIFHHRLTDWGPECKKCHHLLRTPKASFCVNCGESINETN